MTPKKAIEVLMQRLGYRTDSKLKDSVVTEMNLVARSLEARPFLPWFLQEVWDTETLAKDEWRLTLPEDFLMEYEDDALLLLENGKPVSAPKKVDKQELKWASSETGKGLPEAYSLFGNKIIFSVKSEKPYDVHLAYLAKSREIVDAEDEEDHAWLLEAPEYFINEVGAVIANFYLHNTEMHQQFFRQAANLRRELFNLHEARQHVNRDYMLGEGNVS